MTETLSKHEKNLAAIIHASTFSKYFIPFGNFLLPLILWTANKKDQGFVDQNGKQALNFQISLLLYSIIIGIITIPFFIGIIPEIFHLGDFNFANFNEFNGFNFDFDFHPFQLGKWLWPIGIAGFAQLGLFLINIVYTILATIRTNEGLDFKYPISIPFIK
ncbi:MULTISPECIES: DUF4870 domain-containing protein [unclassified Arenibacter]|jgi:uncharacterized Tic20 family protein|uniref:DUF4870 domain-containing protein n=1 Tax=unclassified Arenibacter TaxID=2615047 RepID=UPI000E3544EA|nr:MULTISPECIES: DUF4870 domain-containing protein [unclassified Arenibacter]MCM4163362.1 DUF4870 domain-containing protein [Arenibacter sp. A80]RFT57367.1 DUF4870 domain-containing protein [Arenibacter sp. P308M17]